MDVLDLFVQADRPLRAVEIGHALGIHPSTISQLLKTMVDSGHLVFIAQGKLYFPSPRPIRFGAWLAGCYFGDDRVRKTIEAIQARSGEAVTLAVQNDIFMQIIDLVEPHGVRRIERGVRVPLFGSAIGAALLAQCNDKDIELLMGRARVAAVDQTEIMAGLDQVRRDGYAFGGISPDDQIWSLAMTLPRPSAGIEMVVGIGGAASRMRENRTAYVELMRACIGEMFG